MLTNAEMRIIKAKINHITDDELLYKYIKKNVHDYDFCSEIFKLKRVQLFNKRFLEPRCKRMSSY